MTLTVAQRVRTLDSSSMCVVTADDDLAALAVVDDDGIEVIGGDDEARDAIVLGLSTTDLLIVPAHVARDLSPRRARRLAGSLSDVNFAVVAGPHRLTISQGVTTRPLSNAIAARTSTV